MQSYMGGLSRLQQIVSARRMRGRCHAEGLPPLPSLSELNSAVQQNAFATVSNTISSGASSTITDSVDAVADAVNSSGVDAAAASSIPVEYLGLCALCVGACLLTCQHTTRNMEGHALALLQLCGMSMLSCAFAEGFVPISLPRGPGPYAVFTASSSCYLQTTTREMCAL